MANGQFFTNLAEFVTNDLPRGFWNWSWGDNPSIADKVKAMNQGKANVSSNGFTANDLANIQASNQYAQALQNEIEREHQLQSAQNAMNFEHNEAMLNRNWQEYMSNTAYQRATADMRSAGLNPILAYSNGGATTPAGSSAHGASVSGGSNVAIDTDTLANFINSMSSNSAKLTSSVIDSIAKILPTLLKAK